MTLPQPIANPPVNADQGIGLVFSVAQPAAIAYGTTKIRLVLTYYE
jgi:hypothetical protein